MQLWPSQSLHARLLPVPVYRGDVSHDLRTVEVEQEPDSSEMYRDQKKITWRLSRRLPQVSIATFTEDFRIAEWLRSLTSN